MKIINKIRTNDTSQDVSIKVLKREGDFEPLGFQAMEEISVSVYVDGAHIYDIPCSPEDIPELITGWALTETDLSCDDIDTITLENVPESGCVCRALIATCGSGKCVSVKASRSIFADMDMTNNGNWQWIYELQERFDLERPLRKITKASHSCMLVHMDTEGGTYNGMEVLYQSEDAGRHSAMDKAIGWGIIRDIDMNGCILFTSGRISSAMVQKAVSGGVSALATAKPLVTTGAVEIARNNGLLLAGIDEETKDIHIFA